MFPRTKCPTWRTGCGRKRKFAFAAACRPKFAFPRRTTCSTKTWTGISARTTNIALPIRRPEERIQGIPGALAKEAVILKYGRELSKAPTSVKEVRTHASFDYQLSSDPRIAVAAFPLAASRARQLHSLRIWRAIFDRAADEHGPRGNQLLG